MSKFKLPKNKKELLKELEDSIKKSIIVEDKLELLSFAYLINELVPEDRTNKEVFSNA